MSHLELPYGLRNEKNHTLWQHLSGISGPCVKPFHIMIHKNTPLEMHQNST